MRATRSLHVPDGDLDLQTLDGQRLGIHLDLGRSSHHSSPPPDRNLDNMQHAIRPKAKIPNIAIVGAGIAGLRCADVLIKSGARVTIYEARDRIGGRVREG